MNETVLRVDRGGAAHLILNRPEKLNALNLAVFQALEAHIEDIAAAPVRAVVLRGAGRCFSAGLDLTDLASVSHPPRPNYQSHVITRLSELPIPVISAVHGHCYTGALELALAADIIVAAESAKFADTHAKWAMTPVWGMSQRLPSRLGFYKAREMMFTSRTYSGRQAVDMGLANDCVPDDGLEAAIDTLTADIVRNSAFSQAAQKDMLFQVADLPRRAGLAHEAHFSAGTGPDIAERIARFVA